MLKSVDLKSIHRRIHDKPKTMVKVSCLYQFWFRKSLNNYRETRSDHFGKARIWAENTLYMYVQHNSEHFECRRFPILKWSHIQGKKKLIVKTPLYWFRRGSRDKHSTKIQNSCHGSHFDFR